ncbi:MAG: hypothetical protein QNJ54_32190 [Prochloraceae cyanobacterium]|nr:hypothetical protein [Prochloraceae cyanobacterium]
MNETTIVDLVRRSGISSDVLDRIYSTYSDLTFAEIFYSSERALNHQFPKDYFILNSLV